MTDAEKEIREALAAGPTPGPWCIYPETDGTEICAVDLVPGLPIRQVIAHPKHGANWIANARLIAACSPANVRELLAERDALKVENEKLLALERDMSNALPGVYYMDPPDGGSVSLLEQLKRMANDAARYRWLRENLGKWRIETYQTPVQSMVELHILGDSFFYNGESLDRIIDGQREQK